MTESEKLGLNKSGDTRGMHKRKPETINKQRVRTMQRATAQYIRSCDSKVGKFLRLNHVETYNEILERADAAIER